MPLAIIPRTSLYLRPRTIEANVHTPAIVTLDFHGRGSPPFLRDVGTRVCACALAARTSASISTLLALLRDHADAGGRLLLGVAHVVLQNVILHRGGHVKRSWGSGGGVCGEVEMGGGGGGGEVVCGAVGKVWGALVLGEGEVWIVCVCVVEGDLLLLLLEGGVEEGLRGILRGGLEGDYDL